MFEGWAADVLASYLGKYLDLPRDRLRISLWGGEGILEDVQLRVEAFEYLQLPFVIKEGSVGRLKLQIPWGRWRGGPLVVELSDVVLCVAPREESDWEEGPALRRAQAAKQAQLAAAELAKLGSRVAATGSSSSGGAKPAATAPAAAGAGSGTSWGWVIADYVLSFLLNRLQFAVKNIHVYFQAPDSCSSEYEAFGVKLASLSTVAAGDTPSVLSLFPALHSASAAAAAAVKVVRQLHVQGWSCYWKPRRQQQQQQPRPQQPAPQGQPAASTSGQQHRLRQQHRHAAAPTVAAQDYLLAPVEAVLQVTVHSSSAVSAGGTGGRDSSSAGVLSSGLACDVFLGAGQVGMQLSSQQLVGMARLADDAAVWSKRAKYGCYRPPGWITVQQAAQQGLCWHDSWHESRSRQQPEQQEQAEPAAGPSQLPRTASSSSSSTSSADTGVEELIRSASFSSAAGSCLVPTGRNGVGAPVTWRAVWQYAVHSVLADLRDRRRQQGCWSVQKSDLLARRRYVHLYQQKLDALQPKATAAADSSTDSTADSKAAEGSTAAAVPAAAALADGSSTSESSAALQVELQRLEQQLCVEDILLCRSLAELALERRSSSSDAERCRSWFAWGASSIAGYLYPSAQQASTHSSSTTPSKAPTPSKQSLSSGSAGASMPSEADLDELLEILHIRNSDAGGGAGPREEAAAALEAAQQAAGGRAAAAPDGKPGGLAATALIGLKWQVLRLRAALQDCPAAGATRELLVLDVEGTSITGSLKGGNLSAQLAVQDIRLFDCCSDPGVHECVLQRLDPASPVSAVAGQLLSPSRGWGSGLTGLGLSQAQGLQRMSPEAFGWSGNAMPAVASGMHMRRVTGAPGGASAASADGRGSGPALLTIGVEFAGSSKGVSLQLEPLQLLLRPGCLVAVNSMLEQLPQDTLQQQLAAARAEFEAGSGQYACSRPAGAAAPSPTAAASAAGPRSVRFSDNTWDQPQEGASKAAAPGRPQQLPPALLQLQLTFVVSELLLVLPTELHYAASTNAVLHLQGLKLAAVQGAAADSPLGGVTPPTHQPHPALSSTSSDGAAQPGSCKPRQLLQQQQLTLGLTSLFVGLQQPCLAPAWRHSFDAVQPEHTPHHQQQSRLLELLKLPPVQGTMWLTGSSQAVPSQRRLSTETPSAQALVKVSLQVPPVSCCLSASMLAALQQAAAVLAWQMQLGLPELVASYHLPLQQQLGMAQTASQQPQEQPPQPQKPSPHTPTQAAAAVDAAAAERASSRTPSPTESEVAEWLAAPAPALPSSHAGSDAAAATAPQQLRRCDSDKLLPPAAGHSCDRQQQQAARPPEASCRARNMHEKQQRAQFSQADAAALLAAPYVLLLDLEILLEELDIQYIHDAADEAHAEPQHAPQQPASSPQRATELGTAGSHLRLQASLLSVGFKHSTHGRRAEAGLKDLVLQAGAAAGGQAQRAGGGPLPGLLQLVSSVSVEEVQVAWGRQLGPLAVLQEVQVALEGLQIQGQPGDVGLFLLPASAEVGSSITAAVRTSNPHAGAAASSSLPGPSKGTTARTPPAAASTYVVVGLQNLALGIDGLLHLAAAAASPKSRSKGSTTSKAGAASPTQQQQQDEQRPTAGSQEAKSMLTLEVELSQIQLLSCCSSAGVSPARWQAADSLTQAWQPLQDAAATAPQSGVACELLLDVPAATFSLQPREQQPPQQQQQLIPGLMLQDLALYLPGAPGADLLLPVLHIPRVLLTSGAEAGQQEQQQEQSGFAAVLAQQAECHRLLVPAVASSWRPPQLQHLVQFVGRQEQQWQSWTAAASESSRAADAAQATRPTEQDGGHAQQGAAGGGPAAEAQRQQELSVEVGDVQLLLLPADGTCDKGMLLHWQQLQAVVLQHPQQQQQQPPNHDAAAGQATDQGAANASVLQRTKVSWQDLTVSAIQQDDMQQPLDSATMQQPHQRFSPEDSGQFGTPPGQHSRLPGLQQAIYWAHDLPAVAWLSQGLSSTGRQQGASARHRQPSHASSAGAAAAAAGQAAGSNTLNSHATLSRFLSAQESWRDAASLASSVDGGSGFHTPNASGSMRSASSWITARSSSLSAALSLQAQQQQQQFQPQQQQPLRQHPDAPGGVAAAAAAALGPGSNIIAAWWQAEPLGQSPSGLSPPGLQVASSLSSVLPGWGSLQQPPQQQQQQHPSWSGYASTEQEQQPQAGGRSPPPGRKGVRRSSSFRRGLSMGALQLVGRVGQQQQERGAPSVRSSLNIAPSVYSQGQCQHDDGLTDAELEFYSIAGDSEQDEEREQQLSGLGGSPHSLGLGAGSGAAEEQDAWLHGLDLLPLAGFASRGCQVAASWLLLSLSAVGAAGTDGSPAAVPPLRHPALTLDVWQDMLLSQQAPRGQPVQRQVTDVSLAGLQVQLSSKHWDLVAPCILQAANAAAARPAVAAQQTVRRAAPHQQQLPQGRLSQLHLGLQELQVLLFVPPDVLDAPLQQPRVLLMCSSSSGGAHRDGHSSRVLGGGVQAGQSRRTSSEGFGPWQDPGSEPTTPTAAAGLGSGQAQHLVLPVGAGSSSSSSHLLGCAAQTVTLKLSVELDMQLPAAGRPASLQQLHVPTACVQLGAAPWDAASGRVCAGTVVPGPATQQEQLLLLLAQGMRITAGSPATGLLPGAGLGQRLQVCVSSVSGWVSTTRLTLLLNIQQQLIQELPALNAAAAMAGPSSNAYAAAAAAGGGAPGYISRSELPAAASLTSSASLMNGHAVSSSSASMRRRSMDQQQSAGPRLVLDSSIAVAVNKVAMLVSTDQPEPWLLQQQQQQLSPGRADGSPVSCGLAARAAGSARSPGTRSVLGRLVAPTDYAPLSTCSTPLLEVALLPLDVRLQLLKPCGSRKGAAGQTVVQVDVTARLRADVYSVDKLGWEPVLDPWAFKVGVRLTPSAAASSAASGTRTTASISSSEVLELTAASSCIIASKQLQALAAAAKTWQGEQSLMQQLLQHLAAPAAGSASVSAAGAACWLVNETGAPLSYVVADAIMEPAAATAALGTCASSASSASAASSPVKPPLSSQPSPAARLGASARGQATHLTPVPLRVLDVAAAGYFGRFVQQGGVSDAAFELRPLQPGQAVSQAAASDSSGPAAEAAGAAAAAGSSGVKQSQLLYVQAAGRVEVVGPVALSQMGCSVHPLRALAAGGVLSPGTTPGHGSRRSRQASYLVVEVSRHRYGGRLVSVHSNIQLVNSSGLTLQLGYLSPMALTAQPLPLAVLAPGGSVWLPLQVLQATTPSLCLKPAGLPCSYSWCRALDVYALLPGPSSAPATSGFWYEPAGGRASAPSSTPQYLTFTAQRPGSDGTGGSASLQQADAASASAAAAAAVGSLVLSVGASVRPWPAGVAVHDATSTGVSHGGGIYSRTRSAAGGGGHGSSAASSLWQLVVEPPAVLVNQLPVGVEVSVVAGKGEVRGLAALIDSRQQLLLYGCEAAYYSKLRVQVPGFHSSSWVPFNAAFASPRVSSSTGGSGSAAATAAAARHLSDPGTGPWHAGSSSTSGLGEGPAGATAGGAGAPRQSDVGGAVHLGADASGAAAAVPDVLQLLDQRQVVLSALQAHQAPQVLQLRTCRNKLTGCLIVTVSCSLWIFNCLGSQIAIRQVGPAADSGGSATTGAGLASSTASPLPAAAAPPAAATSSVSSMGMSHGSSSSSSSQVLWLPPYPWMSPSQGSGSSSDLVGLGAAAAGAGAGAYGPPSLAVAWAAARRSDASGGSSRSALQRSRSTPSLLASTAGLEFLAAKPAQSHAAVARGTGPASAGRPTGAPTYQRRASRGEQQHSQGLGLAAVSTAAAAAPAGAFGPSPFAAAASGPTSLAANSAGGSGGLPPTWPQQHEQGPPLQLPARRSYSASAQLQLNSPGGSIELEGQNADAGAHSSFQQAPETAAGADGDAAAPGPGLPRAVRTRRHSSGLHMLASGKLPEQLLPPLQVPDSSAGPPAGCSSYDLLSPTHQQRLLQQMHFQQAAAAAGSTAQLPQYASARELAPPTGGNLTAIVLPLMKPDMSGWLPLLAGGDLSQLTAAAAAFAGPVSTAEVIVAPPPASTTVLTAAATSQAAMQQRVAAAAAAADQLLADMPGTQQQRYGQQPTEQALRRFGSPPGSVSQFATHQGDGVRRADGLPPGRPPSLSGYSHYGQQYSQYSASAGGTQVSAVSGPGLAGLAVHQSHQGAAGSVYQMPHGPQGMSRRGAGSWSGGGFADLAAAAAAAAAAAPNVASSSSELAYSGLPGSVGGGVSAVPPSYAASFRSPGAAAGDAASSASSAAASAAPVMCGWPVHMLNGNGGSGSSAPAGSRSGAAGPAMAAAAAAGSACGFVELQLCAAPAAVAAAMMGKGVQQLPAQWSLPAWVPLLGSQSSPGPCSIVKLPLSVPVSGAAAGGAAGATGSAGAVPLGGGGTAGAGAQGEAVPAAARRRASTRGRTAAGAAGQQEQGACFVSVHTAAIPGGGGAWAVHLLPTYVLVNTLSTEVQLRQYDSELVLQTVPPGGHCCVLWPNGALPLKLQFRVDEPGWSWSGAASVDAPGEFLVKIRHRSRGETLLLQLDVAASSSGIVATLSGRQGGFAPYRIDNCSAEVLHVQQAGCAEQEDVLRPYSSLPYAWDEPSMPHKVLLFLRGHRPLGEFALERVGQVRRVAIPSSSRDHLSRSHTKRLLLITTYAEGPMRVLRVLDTHSHLLQQPLPPAAGAGQAVAAPGSGLEGFSSRGLFASIADAAPSANGSSAALSQQQGLSRPSSSSSLQGAAAAASGSQSARPATTASGATPSAGAAVAGRNATQQLTARNRTLQLLSAFLAALDSADGTAAAAVPAAAASAAVGGGSSGGVLRIVAPTLDVRLSLEGCGLSLVSDSRELLYSSVRGVRLRFCQDALRNAVGAAVASMRVENTLYGCQYPLMLASPVSRSVFGVVYPPGPTSSSSSTARALPAPAAAADDDADAADEAGGVAVGHTAAAATSSAGAGADGLAGSAVAAAAASVAAASAAIDAVGMDAQSIAHAVADELQQQEQLAHQASAELSPSKPGTAATLPSRQPSRSSSTRFKLQQLQLQPQAHAHALQVLQPHHLALGVLATVWRTQPSGVVCVEQLGLQLSPLALSLEGKHLKQLMEFGSQVAAAAADASEGPAPALLAAKGRGQAAGLAALGLSSSGSVSGAGGGAAAYAGGALQQSWPPVQPPSLPAAATSAVRRRLKLYFEEWFISAITLCISFAPGSWFDPSPAGLASAWSGSAGTAAAAAVAAAAAAEAVAAAAAAEAVAAAAAAEAAAAAAAAQAASDAAAGGASGDAGADSTREPSAAEQSDSGTPLSQAEQGASSAAGGQQEGAAAAADAGAAAAAVAAASSSPLPVYLQMALALAHAEEGAWLTLAPFSSTHTMINTESLVQVLGRHYILAAYQELPKVLASLDIFGDPARLLQALGLGFWNLVTLPAHSARWGPYRSLQRLLRGMRVMAYGVSNSIAKGSKRSKAALLPLAPDGLSWQQQQHTQQGGGWGGAGSSAAMHRPGLETGSMVALRSGSIQSAADAAAAAGGSSGGSSNQPGSGQDLLHVLVAGYSLTFQHLLRSFQSGQPLRGVVRAAAQTLVLPALLLLETSESTASSFVRLLAEQVPGAVALRVPRYVASGQLLRPYDRLESLGRALLHHTPGPFLREEFLGCLELQQGLYAVVTVGHLLLLACRTSAAAGASASSDAGAAAGSSKAGPAGVQQQQQQQQPGKQLPAREQDTAGAAASDSSQQRQQQQHVGCVQYKDPQLVFVLDLRDVMMVAAEGSSLRLLCMAGDPAASSAVADGVARQQAGAAAAAAADAAGVQHGSGSRHEAGAEDGEEGLVSRQGSGSAKGGGGDAGGTSGLRELLTVGGGLGARSSGLGALVGLGRLQQRLPAAPAAGSGDSSVPTAAAGVQAGVQAGMDGSVGSSRGRWQTGMGSIARSSMTDAEFESAAAGAAAAVAAAVGGGLMGVDRHSLVLHGQGGGGAAGEPAGGAAAQQSVWWGGCKWFVGHQVPCGSDGAALQLQQLLERACQRVETLLASSAWPRQLML